MGKLDPNNNIPQHDVAIVGGGMVGMALACSLGSPSYPLYVLDYLCRDYCGILFMFITSHIYLALLAVLLFSYVEFPYLV